MGRPRLPNAELNARKRVGEILRELRQGQRLSLDEVCRSLGDNVTRARLWGIEKGNLPYSTLLVQLAALYSNTPESIIELATGQSSLNLLGSYFAFTSEPELNMQGVVLLMSPGEEELVRTYLDWVRYRRRMGARVG